MDVLLILAMPGPSRVEISTKGEYLFIRHEEAKYNSMINYDKVNK